MNQFQRTELIIGKEKMADLHTRKVAIIGLGGVGSYAAEALARAGIQHFLLVDFDKVGITNLNRQLLALHSTLHKNKTELMRDRILDINPLAQIEIVTDFCAQENRDMLLKLDWILLLMPSTA